MLPGDHFFLYESEPILLQILSKELNDITVAIDQR
jgi:surfactin synthase thioesterase subunit